MSPAELWKEYKRVGGIQRQDFFSYYAGRQQAVGIIVGSIERLTRPLDLHEDLGVKVAPQSFQYLDDERFEQIQELVA
jgi:Uncharacterized conserved protein